MGAGVAKNILGLDISMADSFGMDIGDSSHELVGVELDDETGHHLFHLKVLLHHSVGGVGDVVHHNVKIDFIRLVSICVERLSHLDAVGVVQHLQDGKLSVFVSLVLEHFLDGDGLSGFGDGGLEDHSKRPVTDNLLGVVSHRLLLASSGLLVILL